MEDHRHLERNNDSETKGLVNEEGNEPPRSGHERLHEMKNIAKLISDVSINPYKTHFI
jgi:hypothetical protein